MTSKTPRISGGFSGRRNKAAADPVAGLGSIAHDFSNILMVIRNAAGFLKDELPPDDPRQARVDAVIRAADRGARLTNQLQAFGRAQLLSPELVRPAQVVRSMSDMLRHLVPEDVDFRISVRAADAVVLFDPQQLQVVIVNLVSVAAEHTGAHARMLLAVSEEVFDDVKLPDDQALTGHYVSIVVANTGADVDEADKSRVFQPRLTGKHLPKGTDLRLASVHGVVTQSGGFIDVTSEAGRGTMFKVLLPVAPKPDGDAKTASRQLAVHRNVTGSEVILVVEDDAAVRTMVREMLERYGYTVYEAANGAEALHVSELFNTTPDLLITDLVMPELTGRELIEGLSTEGRLPKVLMMSGYTDDEVLRRAKPAEAYAFIKKPFTHQELATKVRQTLDAH
jgi:CheY-like chemotaxis protein